MATEAEYIEWANKSYPPLIGGSLLSLLNTRVKRREYVSGYDTVNFKSAVDWSLVHADTRVAAHVYLQSIPADMTVSGSGGTSDGWDGSSGRWNEINRLRTYMAYGDPAAYTYFNSQSSIKGKEAGFVDTMAGAAGAITNTWVSAAKTGLAGAIVLASVGYAAGLTFGGSVAGTGATVAAETAGTTIGTTSAAAPATASIAAASAPVASGLGATLANAGATLVAAATSAAGAAIVAAVIPTSKPTQAAPVARPSAPVSVPNVGLLLSASAIAAAFLLT